MAMAGGSVVLGGYGWRVFTDRGFVVIPIADGNCAG
ncbi:hypothetical protein LCGC14_2317950 [marine sediment metagenome]|uniref:Uncharacterized protein n=1 Tax=marine sediment metagenome TaxID=412755 RepID=A0A0F9EW41_9ZZZZ